MRAANTASWTCHRSRHRRTADLLGVVEATSRRFVEPMVCAGLNVREDTNPDFMHHKVMIIDGAIVVMGSFNFSGSAANDNDENLLIIHNGDIARAYLEEFNRVLGEWSEPIPLSTFGC
jgi:phosphatidylserine/phosphatidylglycerophosphate/cardiolipin synthase-like enzyme